MHVIYEAMDAMIVYGPLNTSANPWISEMSSGEPTSRSGPAKSAAEEAETGLAWTYTRTLNAFVRIDFFGTLCRIEGWAAGASVDVDLNGQPSTIKPPTNIEETFMILKDLPVGWHSLTILITALMDEPSNLAIERVIVDTGLEEGYQLESTFDAHADQWSTDGDWERRMNGNIPSRRTKAHRASAKFTFNFTEASAIFLYGVAGSDYGGFSVSWVEPGSNSLDEPAALRYAQRSISAEHTLLYMGIVPKGGAKGLLFEQADGNVIGNDGSFPKSEFTRLEVYANPNGNSLYASEGGVPSDTSAVGSSMQSNSPQATNSHKGSSVSPAVIAPIVAIISVLILGAILVFILVRQRQRRRRRHQLEPAAIAMQTLTRADDINPFIETPRQLPVVGESREKLRNVLRASSTESLPEMKPGQFGRWGTSSHDPEAESRASTLTARLHEGDRRESAVLASESLPPAYEETQNRAEAHGSD